MPNGVRNSFDVIESKMDTRSTRLPSVAKAIATMEGTIDAAADRIMRMERFQPEAQRFRASPVASVTNAHGIAVTIIGIRTANMP